MKSNLLSTILLLALSSEVIFSQNDHQKYSSDSLKKDIYYNMDNKNSLEPFLTNSNEIKKQIRAGSTINVKTNGAAGNGIEDDTKIIQSIFDSLLISVLDNGIGGTVYFPPGIYKISQPLKIPPRTVIRGSGAFTQEHAHNNNWSKNKNYNRYLPSVIRLAKNANCNIIEPFVDNNKIPLYKPFESVIIERIALDGNRYKQSGTLGESAGIYMPELPYSVRSGMVIQNVLIFDVNGTAFYDGYKQNEFLLINVFARNNALNGFYIAGEDISMYRVASGENDFYGFHFKGRGAYKCIDLDSWGNKKGVVIENAANGNFFRIQCDINKEEGLYLKGAEDMSFISSIFATNSNQKGEILFSEIKIDNSNVNGYGPFGIKFIGCTIGSGNVKDQTKFGIEDLSEKPRQNIIVGTTFKANEFADDVVNEKVYKSYMIESCSVGNYGGEKFNIDFLSVRKDSVQISPRHSKVYVSETKNCSIILPEISRVKIGKEFQIIKSQNDIKINLKVKDSTPIYYNMEKENTKLTFSYKIIFTGDRWVVF